MRQASTRRPRGYDQDGYDPAPRQDRMASAFRDEASPSARDRLRDRLDDLHDRLDRLAAAPRGADRADHRFAEPAPRRPATARSRSTTGAGLDLERAIADLGEQGRRMARAAGQTRPVAPTVDTSALEARIARLSAEIADMRSGLPAGEIDGMRRAIADMSAGLSRVAPREAIGDLEREIRRLGTRLDDPRSRPPAPSMDGLERRLADISRTLESLPTREGFAGLEADLDGLAARIDRLGSAREPDSDALAMLRDEIGDLRELLTRSASRETVDGLADELRGLSGRMDSLADVARRPVESFARTFTQELATEIGDLRERLDRLADARPPGFDALSDEIRTLTREVERLGRDPDPALREDLRALVERVEDIAARPAPASTDALERQIGLLVDTLERRARDGAGQANLSPKAESLIDSLARRIDALAAAGPDRQSLDDLERLVTRLTDRAGEPDGRSGQLDSIERALADLFVQIEETRIAAIEAADRAARSVAGDEMPDREQPRVDEAFETLRRDLAGLRDEKDVVERRTQSSLEAVHDTLERVVDRLATLETGITRPVPAAPPPAPAPVVMAPVAAPAAPPPARVEPVRAEPPTIRMPVPAPPPAPQPAPVAAPMPAARMARAPIDPDLPADTPLEPGSVSGRAHVAQHAAERIARSEALLEPLGVAPAGQQPRTRSDFLQAAREAAKAASAEPPAPPRKARPAPAPAAAQSGPAAPGLVERARSMAGDVFGKLTKPSTRSPAIAPATREPAKTAAGTPAAANRRRTILLMGAAAVFLVALSAIILDSLAPSHPDPTASVAAPVATAPEPARAAPTAAPAPATPAPAVPARPATPGPVSALPAPETTASVPAVSGTTMMMAALPTARERDAALNQARNAPAANGQTPGPDGLPPAIGGPALRRAAVTGDATAQYEIGARFAEGRGVPQNLTEAARWFERAGTQGLAMAQYRLAALHEKGQGVPRDEAAARRLYRFAAEQGNARAMHNLGVMFAEGPDGTPDYRNATAWFMRAAEHGMSDSQYNLAILYARGLGVDVSLVESYKWFAIAAANGDVEAGRKRDDVAQRLDPAALALAKAAVAAFAPKPEPEAATTVATPDGGWDAAPAQASPRPRRPANG